MHQSSSESLSLMGVRWTLQECQDWRTKALGLTLTLRGLPILPVTSGRRLRLSTVKQGETCSCGAEEKLARPYLIMPRLVKWEQLRQANPDGTTDL